MLDITLALASQNVLCFAIQYSTPEPSYKPLHHVFLYSTSKVEWGPTIIPYGFQAFKGAFQALVREVVIPTTQYSRLLLPKLQILRLNQPAILCIICSFVFISLAHFQSKNPYQVWHARIHVAKLCQPTCNPQKVVGCGLDSFDHTPARTGLNSPPIPTNGKDSLQPTLTTAHMQIVQLGANL